MLGPLTLVVMWVPSRRSFTLPCDPQLVLNCWDLNVNPAAVLYLLKRSSYKNERCTVN